MSTDGKDEILKKIHALPPKHKYKKDIPKDCVEDGDVHLNLKIYYDKMLGKGTFAKVFPGRYKDNIVAVKIITTKHLESNIALQLERELQVIRILQTNPHKNVASYYKIFQSDDKMIIVMELCSGGELTKYIKQGLDYERVKDYFMQILDGYKHLLELNIVHRDIKSANILLSHDKKTIKFIDFGLSKVFSVDLNQTICGSPLYMAPEVLDHQDYDSKSDIWSIGVLLYEMVYGYTPFHHCTVIKTLKQSVQRNNIFYSNKSAKELYNVSPKLISYIKKLLEPNPRMRLDWIDIHKAEWFEENIDPGEKISKEDSDLDSDIDSDIGRKNIEDEKLDKLSPLCTPKHARLSHINNLDIGKSSPRLIMPIGKSTTETNKNIKINKPIDDYKIDISDILITPSDNDNNDIKEHKKHPYTSYMRRESIGIVPTPDGLTIDDLSLIDNDYSEDCKPLVRQQQKMASKSGLIDIDDINEMLITPVPKNETTFEYIRKNTSYLYSRSAPITSMMSNLGSGIGSGIGSIIKSTIG